VKNQNSLDVIELDGVTKEKLRAYLHEYPWIKDYLPKRLCGLKTERADEELLCKETKGSESLYFILGSLGDFLTEAGVIDHPPQKRTLFRWFPKPWREHINETIAGAVMRNSDSVRFTHGYPFYIVRSNMTTKCVTVYKPPKNRFGNVNHYSLPVFARRCCIEIEERSALKATDEFTKTVVKIRSV